MNPILVRKVIALAGKSAGKAASSKTGLGLLGAGFFMPILWIVFITVIAIHVHSELTKPPAPSSTRKKKKGNKT